VEKPTGVYVKLLGLRKLSHYQGYRSGIKDQHDGELVSYGTRENSENDSDMNEAQKRDRRKTCTAKGAVHGQRYRSEVGASENNEKNTEFVLTRTA
jgi:hypothetical protein